MMLRLKTCFPSIVVLSVMFIFIGLSYCLFEVNAVGDDDDTNVLLKLPTSRVYIYTAVAVYKVDSVDAAERAKKTGKFNAVAINGFEVGNEDMPFPSKCCLKFHNGSILSDQGVKYTFPALAIRRAFQVYCAVEQDTSMFLGISMTFEDSGCPVSDKNYKEIVKPKHPVGKRTKDDKTIAVCLKVAFSELDENILTEWLEAYRFLGVNIVYTHTYMLNSHAHNVLQYYGKKGFVETQTFDIPEKEFQKPVNTLNKQGWNDEQVALFDCQTQLILYDYVFTVDTDEFLLPRSIESMNGIRNLFNNIFSDPKVASAHFYSVVHMTSWGPTDPSHRLVIGRYNSASMPIIEREKHVYSPTKIQLGTIYTHSNIPLPGFRRVTIPAERAVVHHFRSCRKSWLTPKRKDGSRIDWIEPRNYQRMPPNKTDEFYFRMKNGRYCYDFRRNRSDDLLHLITGIQSNVERTLLSVDYTKR